MAFITLKPEILEFEALNNKQLKAHVKKAFLSTVILSKMDLMHGYIEVSGNRYLLYVTEEVLTFLRLSNNWDRITCLASFQVHTNDAMVVFCKQLEKNRNIRNQVYRQATCSNEKLAALFN